MYSSWIEISKASILHNLAVYKRIVGKNVDVMPIVKSNAYGHGMVEVAKIVAPKSKFIGVVNLAEALELRKNNIRKRVFVLSYAPRQYLREGIKRNIELPVYDYNYAKIINLEAGKLKKKAKVHIKVDTGTSRVGILPEEAIGFIKKVFNLDNIKVEGVWSHFAASEENEIYTKKQLNIFNKVLKDLEKEGVKIPYKHFGCSAASLVEKKSHYHLIRLGLSLYGLWPSELVKKAANKNYGKLVLKPALSWYTKLIQVKEIKKGTRVSYGCTYTAKNNMKMAVMAVGYWEGYARSLSNKAEVLIKGVRCPVIGRICMNISMIDVSKVKNVKAGDVVCLLGRQGKQEITAEELAEKRGTINYEVVTNINPVLKRYFTR